MPQLLPPVEQAESTAEAEVVQAESPSKGEVTQSETAAQGEVLTKQLVSNVWGMAVAERTGTTSCNWVSSEIKLKEKYRNKLLTQQDPDSSSYQILSVCTALGTTFESRSLTTFDRNLWKVFHHDPV